jgi:hypothetical protein
VKVKIMAIIQWYVTKMARNVANRRFAIFYWDKIEITQKNKTMDPVNTEKGSYCEKDSGRTTLTHFET